MQLACIGQAAALYVWLWWHNAIDVEYVAGVFMVRNSVVDQSLVVRKLGQVNHYIGVVLLASHRPPHK
jgi:hypothetical protein